MDYYSSFTFPTLNKLLQILIVTCLREHHLVNTILYTNTSPSSTTGGPAGIGSRKPKLMTSHMSVCCTPRVTAHALPRSSVVDLQTTRGVGAVGEPILH